MSDFLFDTDVLIDILRGNDATFEQVFNATQNGSADLYCSCITIGEIFAGMKPHEEKPTQKLLDSLIKIPITENIAELAGNLKYKTKTHTLYLDDCFIAASAILNRCVLFTKNAKHYPFKELTIHQVK